MEPVRNGHQGTGQSSRYTQVHYNGKSDDRTVFGHSSRIRMSKGDSVMVAVRVRPLNRREIDMNTDICVEMKNKQITLSSSSSTKQQQRNFSFDHCFWSIDPNNPKFTGQEGVFKALGNTFLDNSFQGYNGCVFAYGQTGSGKSYTMMGPPGADEDRGLIPRLCDSLFSRIAQQNSERSDITCTTEVCYMEIYNERVRDLLMPRVNQKELKVREHHSLGPYVDGLTKLAVVSSSEIERLMLEGNKSRTVAATQMNSESSRSHAVFTIEFRQTEFDQGRGLGTEKVSRISLVDLAGSERASKTGASGDRLKEGSNINLALTTLGRVISSLADISSGKKGKGEFVPYRDSVLTWLLKDSLGGNSKTIMIATISPAGDNMEESLSTLRYADRAKRIVNHAIINEDDNSRIIRELKEELTRLKEMLGSGEAPGAREVHGGDDELAEKLKDAENMLNLREQSWEEKLSNTRKLEQERQKIMEEMGISIQSAGIQVTSGHFYLVNMNADPSMNELLVYNVREITLVGRPDNIPAPQIQLKGLNIQKEHCKLEVKDGQCVITPFENAKVYVNGRDITEPARLYHGYRMLLGNNHWFRVNAPGGHANPPEGESQEDVDITAAKKELAMSDYDDIVTNLKGEKEEAIRKLHDDYEQQLGELRDRLEDSRVYGMSTPESQVYYPPSELDSQSLTRLQETILFATDMVRSANQYSDALKRDVKFSVTIRIDSSYLSPRSRFLNREDITSCVAIRVITPGKGADDVWNVDTLQEKMTVIADLYEEMERHKDERGEDVNVLKENIGPDPFCDLEKHSLIGVANAYLQCLFYFTPHEYCAPIISPQGRNIGKINFTLQRLTSLHPDLDNVEDSDIPFSTGSSYTGSSGIQDLLPGSTAYLQIKIKDAQDLPPNIQFVFCQYRMWGFDEAVTVGTSHDFLHQASLAEGFVPFNHAKILAVEITDEFVEYCKEGVMSIEVLGHRTASVNNRDFTQSTTVENNTSPEKKWIRIRNYISMTAKILELNVEGDYIPVELKDTAANSPSGGTYQLKQGQSRKIQVSVQNVQNSGSIELSSIHNIEIGSIHVRSKQDVPMDSYQEIDFNTMKDKWSHTLLLRKDHIDNEMQGLMDKENKNSEDLVRETKLIDEWMTLQQERNLLAHADFSKMLGMSKNWHLPLGYEPRAPVIFINIDDEEVLLHRSGYVMGENDENMIQLKFKHDPQSKLDATATWDASDHENRQLMSITPTKDRVFIVLRVTVALKHPPGYKIMLRKRLMLRIVRNKTGFLNNIFTGEKIRRSGVVFEIFCGLPHTVGFPNRVDLHPSIMEPHEGESLVQTFRRGMEEISNQLQLDRLRQEISLKEQLTRTGQLNHPSSISPGLASGISSSPHSAVDSESPELESIPGIVVSPPILRPQQPPALLPHTDNNMDILTPPEQSPIEEVQNNFSGHNNNSVSDITPTPDNKELIHKVPTQSPSSISEVTPTMDNQEQMPKVLVQAPSMRDETNSPLTNINVQRVLTMDVKTYLSDDTPEALLTPDLSPDETLSKALVKEQVKIEEKQNNEIKVEKPLPASYTHPTHPTEKVKLQTKPRRSNSSNAPSTFDQMKRKSYPIRPGTPDAAGRKPPAMPMKRFSTPSRNMPTVDFKLNDRVLVDLKAGSKACKVRYIGKFHKGKDNEVWIGLDLLEPAGKHNGTVEGRFYFKCKENHGSFVPLTKVLSVLEKERPSSSFDYARSGTPTFTRTRPKY